MIMKNKRLVGIVLTVALLLLIPLIAMQFTDEVNWTLFDFLIAGVLLLGTGLLCELVMRKVTKIEYRIAICAVILAALILIWIELAVGIFGTPFAGS
jgi:ABC-type Mn2+/Zn2+ transport system permease subunit